MSVYTRIGSKLWMWAPFRSLERFPEDPIGIGAKLLFLHLYTAPEAKLSVPGLYMGSITTMSESMGTSPDSVRKYLDRLLDDGLAEFDPSHRVLRLMMLPDAGESPTNGNTIRGWWRKFQNVPECAVRDSHVPMLYWIMQEWSRSNRKPITVDHMKAWDETFGQVVVPAARPRVRKHVQTSLFGSSPLSLDASPNELSTDRRETLQLPSGSAGFNEIRDSETLREGFAKEREKGSGLGSGSGSQISDQGEVVDQLLAMLGAASGGSWKLPEGSPARVSLVDQVERLGGVDLALLGQWVRSSGLSTASARAREIAEVHGALIAAVNAAERWRDRCAEDDRAAKSMSDTLRAELAACGLGGMVS